MARRRTLLLAVGLSSLTKPDLENRRPTLPPGAIRRPARPPSRHQFPIPWQMVDRRGRPGATKSPAPATGDEHRVEDTLTTRRSRAVESCAPNVRQFPPPGA